MADITRHTSRHRMSQLINSGVDIVTISERLGHARCNFASLCPSVQMGRRRRAAINAAWQARFAYANS
jgi:site-specific recombinase XerD